MSNKNPQANQLTDIIAKVVSDLESQKAILINPANVANIVDKEIDPTSASPQLKTYCSIMQIRDSTRAYLRKRHDPVSKIESQILEGQEDMFSDHMQMYYPVNRDTGDGYVLVEHCTDEELIRCAKRMGAAANKLLSHCDAIYAYINSRQDSVVVREMVE